MHPERSGVLRLTVARMLRGHERPIRILHINDPDVHERAKRQCRRNGQLLGVVATRLLRAWVNEQEAKEQAELKAVRERDAREADLWEVGSTKHFDARRAAVDTPDAGESALMAKPAFWAKPKPIKPTGGHRA